MGLVGLTIGVELFAPFPVFFAEKDAFPFQELTPRCFLMLSLSVSYAIDLISGGLMRDNRIYNRSRNEKKRLFFHLIRCCRVAYTKKNSHYPDFLKYRL